MRCLIGKTPVHTTCQLCGNVRKDCVKVRLPRGKWYQLVLSSIFISWDHERFCLPCIEELDVKKMDLRCVSPTIHRTPALKRFVLLRESTFDDYDILVADLLKSSPHRHASMELSVRKTRSKKLRGVAGKLSQNKSSAEKKNTQPPTLRPKTHSTRSVVKHENTPHFDERTNTFKVRVRPQTGYYDEKSNETDDKDEGVYFHLPPISSAVISPPGEETRLFRVNKPWYDTCNKRQQKALFRVSVEFMYKAAQICNVDIFNVRIFFYWAKMDCGYDAISTHFGVNISKIGNMLDNFIMRMYTRHRPYHLGVSQKHPITLEKIENEYSTYMSLRVGKDHFGKFIPFSSDGSYNHCQAFGGHFGRQELWSFKKSHITKVCIVIFE